MSKTALLGVITIVIAVLGAAQHYLQGLGLPDFGTLIAAITAGIGLIHSAEVAPAVPATAPAAK